VANRLTRIYTRTGDAGSTGLANGSRVDKSSPRIEVIGDVDELNSLVGMLAAEDLPAEIISHLQAIQHILFDLGGELALGADAIGAARVEMIEELIDRYNGQLPPLREFILPGGNRAGALGHLARAVCRRAERNLVRLGREERINMHTLAYLNRLSDLLFVLARVLARRDGGQEIYWKPGA